VSKRDREEILEQVRELGPKTGVREAARRLKCGRPLIIEARRKLGFDNNPINSLSPEQIALRNQPCVEIRVLRKGPNQFGVVLAARNLADFTQIALEHLRPGRVPWPSPFSRDRLRVAYLASRLTRVKFDQEPEYLDILELAQKSHVEGEELVVVWHKTADEVQKPRIAKEEGIVVLHTQSPSLPQLLWNLMLCRELSWLGPGYFPTLEFLLSILPNAVDPAKKAKVISAGQTLAALQARLRFTQAVEDMTVGMKQSLYRPNSKAKRQSVFPPDLLRKRLAQQRKLEAPLVFPMEFGFSEADGISPSELTVCPTSGLPHSNFIASKKTDGKVVRVMAMDTSLLVSAARQLFVGTAFLNRLQVAWQTQEAFLEQLRRKRFPLAECARLIESGDWQHVVKHLILAYNKTKPGQGSTDWLISTLLLFFFDADFLIATLKQHYPDALADFEDACAKHLYASIHPRQEAIVGYINKHYKQPYSDWAEEEFKDSCQQFVIRESNRILRFGMEHAGNHAAKSICRLGLDRISRFRNATLHRHSHRILRSFRPWPWIALRDWRLQRSFFSFYLDRIISRLRSPEVLAEAQKPKIPSTESTNGGSIFDKLADSASHQGFDPMAELDELMTALTSLDGDSPDIWDEVDDVLRAISPGKLGQLQQRLSAEGDIGDEVLRRWHQLHPPGKLDMARLSQLDLSRCDPTTIQLVKNMLSKLDVDEQTRVTFEAKLRGASKRRS